MDKNFNHISTITNKNFYRITKSINNQYQVIKMLRKNHSRYEGTSNILGIL